MVETIFDIGMYDGADTAYYLDSGYRVVAVEANPELVARAKHRFMIELGSGQLICLNAAISANGSPVSLTLSGEDLGASTLFADRIRERRPIGAVEVPGTTIGQLFARYGVPKYLKVDIEGADRYCILPLTSDIRPPFLSFEIGNDAEELLAHVAGLGYNRFKIIEQNSFREAANVECLYDRFARRLMQSMGYADPMMIKRAGRFFVSGHSSGPVPWLSDGLWRSLDEARCVLPTKATPGWSDLHATIK